MKNILIFRAVLCIVLVSLFGCSSDLNEELYNDKNYLQNSESNFQTVSNEYQEEVSSLSADISYRYEYPKLTHLPNEEELSNIPDDILVKMDTASLLMSIIDYPRMYIVFSNINTPMQFYALRSRFNGIDEFLNRSDCVEVLLKYYQAEPLLTACSDNFEDYLPLEIMEMLFAQKELISNLDKTQRSDIFNVVIAKNEEKIKHMDVYTDMFIYTFGKALAIYQLLDELDQFRDIKSSQSDYIIIVPVDLPNSESSIEIRF